ncbi:MAG: aminotransferase class I/II-fold pyridoxal phosphate-dependent enzyme [Clostridiales bacterium]|jgi:aminotransferase|nr:aminotransferase class I/II-fold pyridoxal phosphate-dependent enzyme [Clostridiales bacterium]
MPKISEQVRALPFSGIRKFFDVANEVPGVISLGVGEPDYLTPWSAREAAIYNLEHGRTVYSSNAGLPELRKEISKYLERSFGLSYDPADQILVTVGASEGIDLAMRALIDPGDEVLVHEPCYVSYKPCVALAGGVPVPIATKAGSDFRLTPEELLAAITPKTRALILSYPNNPTGAVMRAPDLAKLADILRDRDIAVVSDEIYAELTYSGRHVSIASFPGMAEKTVVLNGFSKASAMTGWRLGYAAGPKDIVSAMLKVHQYTIMCAPTTSQYAGIEALRSCGGAVAAMREDYDARRRVVLNGFREIGLPAFEPLGAFYIFPSLSATGLSSEEFSNRLLFESKVAVVPGTAFGGSGEGFIRCSYAYSIDSLKAALERIGDFARKLPNRCE